MLGEQPRCVQIPIATKYSGLIERVVFWFDGRTGIANKHRNPDVDFFGEEFPQFQICGYINLVGGFLGPFLTRLFNTAKAWLGGTTRHRNGSKIG